MKSIDLALVQACAIHHAEGFCLFLPHGKNDEVLLLSDIDGDEPRHAFFLGGKHHYSAMVVSEDNPRKGIYLTDIKLRVSLDDTYDPAREGTIAGSLIINGDKVFIGAKPVANNTFGDIYPMFLRHEEGITGSGVEVGFLKWSIEAGSGSDWTEVHAADVTTAPRSR